MISLIKSVFDLASTTASEAGLPKGNPKTDPRKGRAATKIEVKRMIIARIRGQVQFNKCVSKVDSKIMLGGDELLEQRLLIYLLSMKLMLSLQWCARLSGGLGYTTDTG